MASPLAGTPDSCEQAAAGAEAAHRLPAGLLLAIGRIESGRWDAARGRTAPWPWTINAAGKGQWFETRAAAVQAVEAARAAGIRSIDTGCFQISLLHHPGAFANLDQAFDPGANAAYAARFLLALFARAGSWEGAVENYHSADPARGLAYREQVFSAWFAPGATPAMVRTGMPPGLLPATRASAGPANPNTANPNTASPDTASPNTASLGATDRATVPGNLATANAPRVTAGVRVWTPMEAGSAPSVVAMPPPVRPSRKPPVSN